jgi:hypothetical protein
MAPARLSCSAPNGPGCGDWLRDAPLHCPNPLYAQGGAPSSHSWSVKLLFICWAGGMGLGTSSLRPRHAPLRIWRALAHAAQGGAQPRRKLWTYAVRAWAASRPQPGRGRPWTPPAASPFLAAAVFSVIMLSAYTANLTANLTVSKLGSAIKNLADLKRAAVPFGVPADSSVSRCVGGATGTLGARGLLGDW